MTIELIILDAFGTCVEIMHPTHPYSKIGVGRDVMKRNQPFDELTDDPEIKLQLHDEIESMRVFPDYYDFMERCGPRLIAIGSNLATPYAERLREILKPSPEYFHLSCEVGEMKPEPQFYFSILKHFGLKPEQAMMIGDSARNDFIAPARLGIRSILLSRDMGMTLRDIVDQRL